MSPSVVPRTDSFDVAIIGGGILGLATGLVLLRQGVPRLVLLEAESRLAAHQTGHNSGVIHSGIYYRPGSLKAMLCSEGRAALYRLCAEYGVPHERCGKVIVASHSSQLAALAELERRASDNGLVGVRRLDSAELKEREPGVVAAGALLVEETGIVAFPRVAEVLATRLSEGGGVIHTRAAVTRVVRGSDGFVLQTPVAEFRCRNLVNCSGLQSDRVARMCGLRPDVAIVPFRGEYYDLRPERRSLVRHLVYPVPDPSLPFLGVHLSRSVDGRVHAGPNAVLALARHGYERYAFSTRDIVEMFRYPGAWRMARRYWRAGLEETVRSLSRSAFARSLQALVPAIQEADLVPGPAGVRAQAVARDGTLVDDFRFAEAEGMFHVLNAPSPAATAALAIARVVAERARAVFRPRSSTQLAVSPAPSVD